jgi:3-hydroxyacyl-CoA dehydrogenase
MRPFPSSARRRGWRSAAAKILLHCAAIQAHTELSIGLVETRIGVVPGWGGCKDILIRQASIPGAARDPVAPAIAAFNLIAPAKISGSAFEARNLGFLRPTDGITMNRDRLLADAKRKALELAKAYTPPEPPKIALSGPSGASAIRNLLEGETIASRAMAHDRIVGAALIEVLTGGAAADPLKPLAEDDVLAREKKAFTSLLGTPESVARVKHMLATGTPLRN